MRESVDIIGAITYTLKGISRKLYFLYNNTVPTFLKSCINDLSWTIKDTSIYDFPP